MAIQSQSLEKIQTHCADLDGRVISIQGWCVPDFHPVLEAFEANFKSGEDVGAACALYQNGRLVVNLWGGFKDAAKTQPWEQGTLVNMMSVAKGVVATAVAVLVDQRRLDLDAPVADVWPEFAANGKAKITIRQVLDHTAGLPVLRPSGQRGDIYDWDVITGRLAQMAPLWEPGTQAGYHILTMGFLAGEIIRRVSGMMPGDFIQREVTGPLDVDYAIGLNDAQIARVAEFIPAAEGTIFDVEKLPEGELLRDAWREVPYGEDFNTDAWFRGCIPGGNGHGTARGVAKLYGCLAMGGTLDGVTLLTPETLALFTQKQHNLTEVMMKRSYHQALGFLKNSPPISAMGPNIDAFGHHGVGGSIGLADPACGVGFCYAPNQMHARIDNGPRAGRLKDAAFSVIYGPQDPRS